MYSDEKRKYLKALTTSALILAILFTLPVSSIADKSFQFNHFAAQITGIKSLINKSDSFLVSGRTIEILFQKSSGFDPCKLKKSTSPLFRNISFNCNLPAIHGQSFLKQLYLNLLTAIQVSVFLKTCTFLC